MRVGGVFALLLFAAPSCSAKSFVEHRVATDVNLDGSCPTYSGQSALFGRHFLYSNTTIPMPAAAAATDAAPSTIGNATTAATPLDDARHRIGEHVRRSAAAFAPHSPLPSLVD